MASSINELLNSSRFAEPEEVKIIKDFLREKFQSGAQVAIQKNQITIGVSSAALAGALRLQLHELQALCQTEKRLVIRIGS